MRTSLRSYPENTARAAGGVRSVHLQPYTGGTLSPDADRLAKAGISRKLDARLTRYVACGVTPGAATPGPGSRVATPIATEGESGDRRPPGRDGDSHRAGGSFEPRFAPRRERYRDPRDLRHDSAATRRRGEASVKPVLISGRRTGAPGVGARASINSALRARRRRVHRDRRP